MDYLVLGIVAGLAAVERKGFLQAMLSRPVALAPLSGWLLGDVEGGVLLAAPLELFWLGSVNLGAALPVHEALGTAAIALLAVLLCAPLALLGRRADRIVEMWNERLAVRAEAALAGGHPRAAVRMNLYGLAAPFAISALLAPLGAAVAAAVIPAVLGRVPRATFPLELGFVAFSAFAAGSGAKALRAKDAPLFFFAALACAAVAGLLLGRIRS